MKQFSNTESNVQIGYLRKDGTSRYIFTGRKTYNFDSDQTALLDKILPLIASGEYEGISEVIDNYYAIPF